MVDRILGGRRPSDGVVGLWISKPGKDISSSDPDDFLFDPTKYMARAYMRVVSGVFTKGELARVVTFADGTKTDNYFWYCNMPVPLGYVPTMVAQIGNEADLGFTFEGEVYYKSGMITIKTGDIGLYRYNASDPNKTPITGAGSAPSGNSGKWSWDWTQNFITYTKGNNTNFIIYRNPLVPV